MAKPKWVPKRYSQLCLIFHSNMDFGSGLGCLELDGQSNNLGFCVPIGPLKGGPKSGPTFTRGFHVCMGFGPTFWTALVTVTWVGIYSVTDELSIPAHLTSHAPLGPCPKITFKYNSMLSFKMDFPLSLLPLNFPVILGNEIVTPSPYADL